MIDIIQTYINAADTNKTTLELDLLNNDVTQEEYDLEYQRLEDIITICLSIITILTTTIGAKQAGNVQTVVDMVSNASNSISEIGKNLNKVDLSACGIETPNISLNNMTELANSYTELANFELNIDFGNNLEGLQQFESLLMSMMVKAQEMKDAVGGYINKIRDMASSIALAKLPINDCTASILGTVASNLPEDKLEALNDFQSTPDISDTINNKIKSFKLI